MIEISLPLVSKVVSIALLAWGLQKVQNIRLWAVLAGAGVLLLGDSLPSSPVNPPHPPPSSPLADRMRPLWRGSPSEAQTLSALHEALALALEFDGTRSSPRVTDTSKLGQVFADIQRYRMGGETTPWAQKWRELEVFLASEARSRGVLEERTAPIDSERRTRAIAFFREVAQAFSQLGAS